jgi:redox-sensitive bicupin YhaK (pirin superfamily)
VVSGYEDNKAIHIESEATIYKGNFEEGKDTVYEVSMGMGVFIYVTEGILEINGIIFSKGDQARIIDEKRVVIMAKEYVSFALISVAL